MKKRKTICCLFAHPDDETFGPGGTIAKLAKSHDVYLITLTKGEAGEWHGEHTTHTLAELRERELKAAAKILGIKKVYFLGFTDGELCNKYYHDIAAKAEPILRRLKPVTLVTLEPRGLSGHLDHIAASMITSFLFHRLPFIKKVMQYCHTEERAAKRRKQGYFVYVPPGYKQRDIGETIDIARYWETKVRAMHAHRSQIRDPDDHMKWISQFPKEENFLILKR